MTAVAIDTTTGDTRRSPLEHLPALDGLRGACLAAVLLFHSGFAWASGGFLGVSTFFTLSGFLITTLLLREQRATGAIALRRFWERRLRRLLPASLLTIVLVVVTAPLWLPAAQQQHLADDAFATVFYAANWRFMSPEYAYDLIFIDPSPLQHFWSLAIEGQFYVVFPLLAGLVLRRGGTRALAAICALATVASIAVACASPSLEAAQHRLYYGTDARAGELLIGALLALLRDARSRSGATPTSVALRVAGPVAALLLLVAWSFASVGDAWLYRGGFALYATCSAVVVAAAALPDGPVHRVLSLGWLRWIGKVSYGAYLFHWPLFLLLTPARTGLSPMPLLVLRVAATLGLAALSYRFVEHPIRRSRAITPRRFVWTAAGSVLLVVAVIAWSNPLAALGRVAHALVTLRGVAQGDPWKLRVASFGDSTAGALLVEGLHPWLSGRDDTLVAGDHTDFGCGVLESGEIANRGVWQKQRAACRDFLDRWQRAARQRQVQVAVVLIGPWEVRTRRAHPKAPPRALGDPELDARTRAAITRAVDNLVSGGASVVWLTAPHIDIHPLADGVVHASDREASDPARIDRLNELIREVAASHPESMRVVDLAGYLASRPAGEMDPALRPDGVHFTPAAAREVVDAWLGEAILGAARELRDGTPAAATPTAAAAR